ncbi:hypothetical protein IQ24_03554 [Paracoccus sulfuroxidans]|uniref:Uncharacterized protein n=1 Tax=Paracoccus sulfuroxidans TaxID=384678 RepID=A0A562NC87_9RHOB|nr:hypothetical protein IQ24_03554 [Paracoccus sulfuroxidans]
MNYRQRFTTIGWIGAALFLLGPMVFAWVLTEYLTAAASYSRPDEAWVYLSAMLAPLGALLALIGREYYDATAEVARARATREAQTRNIR